MERKRKRGDQPVCPECGSDRVIPWTETTLMPGPRPELKHKERLRCKECGHEFPRDDPSLNS